MIRFINDWWAQGDNNAGVYHFTLFRVWYCSWSIGIEFCNFGVEWER